VQQLYNHSQIFFLINYYIFLKNIKTIKKENLKISLALSNSSLVFSNDFMISSNNFLAAY